MKPGQTKLVVTVPNAFRLGTLLWLLRGIEYVHPDHNYWFSYLTITNLVKKNGFVIDKVFTYTFQKYNLIPGFIKRRFSGGGFPKPGTVGAATSQPIIKENKQQILPLKGTISFLRNLPMRLLLAWLYSRTPFWADGIVVIAKIGNADAA
jgi:hypothetical protein